MTEQQNVKLSDFQFDILTQFSKQIEELDKQKAVIAEKTQLTLAVLLDAANVKIKSTDVININPTTKQIEVVSKE